MKTQRWIVLLVFVLCLDSAFASRGMAETLFPLATEDAAPLPHGVAEPYFGFTYFRNQRFPPFTPRGALRGQDLFALPQFGVRVGAGDWVEIQASYEFLLVDETLRDGRSHSAYGGGDARLFAKVRLLHEANPWPAVGLRFGTKLPNANRADRLGTDETDFHIETLLSREFGAVTAHANLGIAILGNSGPAVEGDTSFDNDGQDDLFTWSLGVVGPGRALAAGERWIARPLAEIRGTLGSRYDNDGTGVRLGAQLSEGRWSGYLGMSAGLAGATEDLGVLAGAIYRLGPGRWFR